jgi:hypothetical protein
MTVTERIKGRPPARFAPDPAPFEYPAAEPHTPGLAIS